MKRREFITLLGGTMGWPLAARAQQPDHMRTLGVLMSIAEDDPEVPERKAAIERGLESFGWTNGRNLTITYRWAGGDLQRLRTFARELVELQPDVILVNGTPALISLQERTQTIPIVFVNVADPVGGGLVDSLAKPGRNITGFTHYEFAMGGKWLEAVKEVAPGIERALVIFNSENAGNIGLLRAIESTAPALGTKVVSLDVHKPAMIEPSMDGFVRQGKGALLVLPDFRTSVYRDRIIALAMRHRLPGVYPFRSFAASGGLMAYGVDSNELYRRGAASYIDRILRGTEPTELPVQAPTKFELIINLKAAKALGLTVPPSLLARADEVIE